jgi:hypothetical protein
LLLLRLTHPARPHSTNSIKNELRIESSFDEFRGHAADALIVLNISGGELDGRIGNYL